MPQYRQPLRGLAGRSTRAVRKSRLSVFLIVAASALLPPAVLRAADAGPGSEPSGARELDEIVVSAQKRSERIEDVPIPVTVVDGQALADSNQLRLQDYYVQIPGLAAVPNTGNQLLAIRGITTGGGNPTVGVTIDDVSYSSSTAYGGNFVPDIDPSEIQRVEVLRGPQGTLYGASSLGGLVKYVTIDPSTDRLSGHVEASTDAIYNGAQLGYNFRAALNVPLGDTLAIRASAFTRRDPGYVDNPVLGIDGVNEAYVSGGRLAGLWQPSNLFSLKLSALFQYTHANGLNDVNLPVYGYPGPPLSDLQQNYIPGAGQFFQKLQAYSATGKVRLGSAELVSITAFNVSHFFQSADFSSAISDITESLFSVGGAPLFNNTHTQKVTEELRLTMPLGEHVDWLLGGFFTHERSPFIQYIDAENLSTGAIVGQQIAYTEPQTYKEYSVFTDLTLHLTDRFAVQLGGRETHVEQSIKETDSGPLVDIFESPYTSPVIYPLVKTKDQAFTYLVTPQFEASSNLMVYARLASGYRPGGPNESAAPFGLPLTFKPDKTQNYELGVKGSMFDRRLSVDLSVYYISWKDIQLNFEDSQGFTFYSNGGRTKSEGVELSLQARPATGLTVGGWFSYDEAKLTQDLSPETSVYGVSGDRLPFSSRISANLSSRQEFRVTNGVTGFLEANLSYVGNRMGNFETRNDPGPQTPREVYPPYAKLNLLTGARFDAWALNLSATNVTNRRGILNGGQGNLFPSWAYIYIQPRTISLSVSRQF